MTDKQQTAVQWLYEMLVDNKYLTKDAQHLINHALEMEKEQRIEDMRKAFYKGVESWMQNPDAQESIFNELIQQ